MSYASEKVANRLRSVSTTSEAVRRGEAGMWEMYQIRSKLPIHSKVDLGRA